MEPERNRQRERQPDTKKGEGQTGRRGVRLGTLFGVGLEADWSVLIIFFLVLGSLGMGVLPQWHPQWTSPLIWGVALAAATLFFLSVLAHELSHALMARAFGVKIQRITLFLFGGMAHMEEESRTPSAELFIALAGPLMSFFIGGVATILGMLTASVGTATMTSSPQQAVMALGPVSTLLLWLGPINFLLGAFNLVPGFPLDGGRVLRALLWLATGSLKKATRWAAGAGQVFAWMLMGMGVAMALGLRVPFFGQGLVNGLWLLLIGWFLNSAARTGWEQFVMLRALKDVSVADVMRTSAEAVQPDVRVDVLVRERMMASDQHAYPVTPGDDPERVLGTVSIDDVRRVPRDEWARTSVSAIMTPADQMPQLEPDDAASDALNQLARRDLSVLPVVEKGRLRGVVRLRDIMRWLALSGEVRR